MHKFLVHLSVLSALVFIYFTTKQLSSLRNTKEYCFDKLLIKRK